MEEEKTEPPPVVDQENIVLESESLPSGSRGDEGILEGVAITDNLEETYSSESDEGEEGIIIHAGRTTSQKRAPRKSFGKTFNNYTRPDALSPQHPSFGAPSSKGDNLNNASSNIDEELKKLRFLRHATAFDVDINALEDHPWRSKTVDLLDYFNYGFNERTWMQYCEKQLRLRAQKGLGPYQAPAGAATSSTLSGTIASLPPASSGPPGFIPPQFLTPAVAAPIKQEFAAPPPAPPSFAQMQAPGVPARVFEVPPPTMVKPALQQPQAGAVAAQVPTAPPAAPVAPAMSAMPTGFMPPPPLPGGRPGPPPGQQIHGNPHAAPPGPPQAPQAPQVPQAPPAPNAALAPAAPHAPQQGAPPNAFPPPSGELPPHPSQMMGFNPQMGNMNHMGMGQGGQGMDGMYVQGHFGMQGGHMGMHPGMMGMGMPGMLGMNPMGPGFDMYGREIGGLADRGNEGDHNREDNRGNRDRGGDRDFGRDNRDGRDPRGGREQADYAGRSDDRFAGKGRDRERERERERGGGDPRQAYESSRDRLRDGAEEAGAGKRKYAAPEDNESSKRRASSRDRDYIKREDGRRDDARRGDVRDSSRATESKHASRDGRDKRDSRDRDEGRSGRRSSSRDRGRDAPSSRRTDKDRDREKDRERSDRPSDRTSGRERERSPERRARR